MKVRQDGRIISVAVIIAVGVHGDGRREILGMTVGASEAETFWVEFLRSLTRRGLRGVKLVISDADEGLKGAVSKILNASWQRCCAQPGYCTRSTWRGGQRLPPWPDGDRIKVITAGRDKEPAQALHLHLQ